MSSSPLSLFVANDEFGLQHAKDQSSGYDDVRF